MNPPNQNEPHSLAPMMERARRDPFFVGFALDDHARREGWDDAALAEHLRCPRDRLPHLFLCRCPDDSNPRFAEQVRGIAEYAACDETQLLHVLRAAVVWAKLSGAAGKKANAFLLAARDRHDAKNQRPEEEKPDENEAP